MNTYGGQQLAAAFRTVRKNTLQTAEDIPESSYGFVPAPNTNPVARTLTHIAVMPRLWTDMHETRKLTTLEGYDFFGVLGPIWAEQEKERSKAEIIELLTTEGEKFAAWLDSLSFDFLGEHVTDPSGEGSKSRLESLMSVKEHEMHHRGQLMLVERMLGIVPHLTRQREEFAQKMKEAKASG